MEEGRKEERRGKKKERKKNGRKEGTVFVSTWKLALTLFCCWLFWLSEEKKKMYTVFPLKLYMVAVVL